MNLVETKSAVISVVDNDTLKVVMKPNAYVSKIEYETFAPIYFNLAGRKKEIKFLVIVQEGLSVENKVMNFFQSMYRTDFKKAEAYIVLDPTHKLFFKVALKLAKIKYPVRLFENEREALIWLNTIE